MKRYELVDTVSKEWFGSYETLEDAIDTAMCLKEREYCITTDGATVVMTVKELKEEIEKRWDEYEIDEM